jgi:hypothetical protein
MTPGLLAALIFSLMHAAPRQEDDNGRDAAVYEAVLRHTILPESQRFNAAAHHRAVSRVLVADQTFALCGAAGQTVQRRLGCLRDEDVRRFEEELPRGRGFIFEKLLSGQTRVELATSLRDRNGASYPFAARALSIVEPVPPGELPVVPIQQLPARDFALFSRPGYSMDGRALVYARYVCASLCGYVWLFLLEQRAGEWEVADVHILWIS